VARARSGVDVAPTMEWLAEDLLVARLKAQLSPDVLLADPIVYTIDEGTLPATNGASS
jgi:hypothetical protein